MSNYFLKGSICLSNIPKSQIKKVMCKDGVERMFLNIAIFEKKNPSTFGDRTYTHSMSCAPRAEERENGVNYYIADLETISLTNTPTSEDIAKAPCLSENDDLPF